MTVSFRLDLYSFIYLHPLLSIGWSLSALFEKKITKSCPLAHHSSVVVKKSQAPFDQEFVLDAVADKISDNGDSIFDLSSKFNTESQN